MNRYIVYILRTEESDVKYVGVTNGELKKRLTKHYYDVNHHRTKNIHKINWFIKNKGKIIIEKIDESDNHIDMLNKEKYWISYYRDKGYNLINKTDGGQGCYGYRHDEETLSKISGINNHRWGIPNLRNKDLLGKKVEYSKDGVNWTLFNSIKDASKFTGKTNRFVRNMCGCNYVRFNGDCYFRYLGSDFKNPRNELKRDQSIRKKKVEAIIKDKTFLFDSASDAADYFGLKRCKIVMVCNGVRNKTGGIVFRYKEKNIKF